MLTPLLSSGQILFAEECFTGGVTVTGAGNVGVNMGVKAEVRWQPDFTIRRVYALTHRFGHIAPHSMYVNGGAVRWDTDSQVGPETPLSNPYSNPFAVHACDVTNQVGINDSTVIIDFPPQQFYSNALNWGWWSIYLVILYESPQIDEDVCFRLYTADQRQDMMQTYNFLKPDFQDDSPLLFSLFAARINNVEADKSRIWLNGEILGDIMGNDPTVPATIGTQGHFYYEQKMAFGLNGDTANQRFIHHDAIAIINEQLDTEDSFSISAVRIVPTSAGSENQHPAFTFTYTPSCPVISADAMPRSYTLCRGDSTVLQGVEGFEHYAWSPALQLSDSTAMNTTCTPDSSRWYRLRMWNDDAAQGCPLTIPVWVEVGQTPVPGQVTVVQSSCPASTGAIRFEDMAGTPPYNYSAGDLLIESPLSSFINLPAGSYPISITDALGCTWDSTAVIELNTPQSAAFRANPTEGVSPLDVYFGNQSTGADAYLWLIDGEPVSTSTNAGYTFADSGSYEVSLVAMLSNPDCADTASVIILVEPGIQLIVPNIFTPNGDGRNDKLVAQVLGSRKLSWTVYNRWGNALHSDQASLQPQLAEALELWDGQTTAGQASDGSYMLVIVAEGIRGKVEKMQFAVQVTGAGR